MVFAAATCRGRLFLALCSGFVLIGVSACTIDSSQDRPDAEATPTRTITTTPDDPLASPSDDETPDPVSTAVCVGERAYNLDSAPYAGKGPHRMTIIHKDPAPATLELQYVTLPDGWDPAVDIDSTRGDLKKIQLVVCDDAVATGDVMGTCTFDEPGMSGTMDVVQAEHTFVVREARTGRRVADFSLPGTAGTQESCPSMAMDTGGTQIAQAVNDDVVAAKLRSLYEGPAS